jgi:hypothetical protein
MLKSVLAVVSSSEFELSILLKLSFDDNRLVLMFDGVEEVSDYKEQLKMLVNVFEGEF